MDPQEHIHIISAGDCIYKTYPAVLKDLRTVTHTLIVAEKEVYTNSARDDAQKRMWKCAIRNTIDEVNTIYPPQEYFLCTGLFRYSNV